MTFEIIDEDAYGTRGAGHFLQRVAVFAADTHQVALNRRLSFLLRILDQLYDFPGLLDRDALLERGAIPDAPIPLLQSVLIVWPQIVGLVAGSILLFVIAYVVFQRQEVRA